MNRERSCLAILAVITALGAVSCKPAEEQRKDDEQKASSWRATVSMIVEQRKANRVPVRFARRALAEASAQLATLHDSAGARVADSARATLR